MFVLDSLLVGGLRFVLDKIATVAYQELHNEDALRERLLEAQLRLELGEIDEQAFAAVEKDVLDRVREIKAREQGEGAIADGEHRVTGVEISVRDDDA